MGNRSRKTDTKAKPGMRKARWRDRRDMVKAGQPRGFADWQGMKLPTIALKVFVNGRRVAMPVLYASGSHGIPLRKRPALKLEINQRPQPWQKLAAKKQLAA